MPRAPGSDTSLAHLYRGELGRLTTYHQRLDTTTSWAISALAAIASLAMGDPSVPHALFLLLLPILLFFLVLEARRFRHYQASRVRVHMLERNFFVEQLEGPIESGWITALLDNLRGSRPPLSQRAALGWRLRRSYLALFSLTLLGWLYSLGVIGSPSLDPGALISRAGIQFVPGWVVILAVLAFYAWLIELALLARRRYPEGEDW